MKINGRTPSGPNTVEVVIPRGDGNHFRFKAKAVLNYSDFEKLQPAPLPPKVQRPGGQWAEDIEDPSYKKLLAEHNNIELQWMYVQSLSATEGLTWDTIKPEDPSTCKNWRDDLMAAGFSRAEIGRLVQAIWQANCLDDKLVEEARKSFSVAEATPTTT